MEENSAEKANTSEEPTVILRKIPLEGFITMLDELYQKGADFIDIIGKPDKEQDIISIVVRYEYIDPDNDGFTEEDDGDSLAFTHGEINPIDLI